MHEIDPEDFAPASIVLDRQRQAAARHRGPKFDRFPTPWTNRLLRDNASGAAWSVAALLVRRKFIDHKQTIRLANTETTQKRKWRGLAELEKLGLVSIERRPRRSPIVTMLYLEETDGAVPI